MSRQARSVDLVDGIIGVVDCTLGLSQYIAVDYQVVLRTGLKRVEASSL